MDVNNSGGKLYAAVKFYSDKTHVILPVDAIDKFTLKEYYTDPFMIKRNHKLTGDVISEPGEILAVSDNYEELSNNKKRYRYSKLRVSEALQILADQSPDEGENHEEISKQNSDNSKRKMKKNAQSQDIISCDQNNDNTEKNHGKGDSTKFTSKNKSKTNKLTSVQKSNPDEELTKVLEKRLELMSEDTQLNFDEKCHVNESEMNLKVIINTQKDKIREQSEEIVELQAVIDKKNRKLNKKKVKISNLKQEVSSLKEKLDQFQSCQRKLSETGYHSNFEDRCLSPVFNTKDISRTMTSSPTILNNSTEEYTGSKRKLQDIIDIQDKCQLEDSSKKKKTREEINNTQDEFESVYRLQKEKTVQDIDIQNEYTLEDKLKEKKSVKDIVYAQDEYQSKNKIENQKNMTDVNDKQDEYQFEDKLKKKTLRDILPKIDYDSDTYRNDQEYNSDLKNFTPWTKSVKGQNINMFHLCYGVSILKSEWNSAKKKNPSIFIRQLADALWGSYLSNRVFQVNKASSSKCDNSQVKAFTPKKLATLQKTYHYYLKCQGHVTKEKLMSMTIKEKAAFLSEWRIFLKSKVNTVRCRPTKKDAVNNDTDQSFGSDLDI